MLIPEPDAMSVLFYL